MNTHPFPCTRDPALNPVVNGHILGELKSEQHAGTGLWDKWVVTTLYSQEQMFWGL